VGKSEEYTVTSSSRNGTSNYPRISMKRREYYEQNIRGEDAVLERLRDSEPEEPEETVAISELIGEAKRKS